MIKNEDNSIEADQPLTSSPTLAASRIDSLDVLRGIAVLMIFVVNVKMMANGFNHYVNRSLWEGEVSQWITSLQSWFVHGKFVTIFTALFGAGLALLLARTKPVPVRTVLRRLFWLVLFGALHLILLREGDILIWYALVGFVAVPFVRLGGVTLILVGLGLQMTTWAYSEVFPVSEENVPILWQSATEAHHTVSEIMLGTVGDQISARIDAAPYYMWDLFVVGGVWLSTLSVILIGMGLLKTGFLSGKLPLKSYAVWSGVGLAIAAARYVVPVVIDEDSDWGGFILIVAVYAHYLGGALAWSGLIVAAVRSGWKATAFAAVGRTAFTVYIMQSVIGLLLFSSLGLGLFGQLSLGTLMLITLAVWLLFLTAAPLWLKHFRFGPLEWLWRSLTYGQLQPMPRT
ncbi:MAG: DUF418 domain-containing protein [Pseudomonadota bacterium]